MSFVAIAIGGAAVVGAGVSMYEGSKSRALAASQAGFADQITSEQFGEQQGYVQQLNTLMANPASVTTLPGYQFLFDQGQTAVARSSAAGGFLNSGNEGAALVQYGQGMATSFLNQQEALLASLSGLQASSSSAQNLTTGNSAVQNANAQTNALLAQLGIAGGYLKSSFGSAGSPSGTTTNPGDAWTSPGYNFDGSANDAGAVDYSAPPPGFS